MVRSSKKTAPATQTAPRAAKRAYLSQSDVPRHSIDEALRVPQAISDQYGKKPTRPIDVAKALRVLPTTGRFRSLAGAALAYDLTDGGPHSAQIGLSDLGRRIVSPVEEGDDLAAKREALMRPRVVREFLEKYDGSKWPSEAIGKNVLEDMGVPRDATQRTHDLILESAGSLGFLTVINGQSFVNLKPALTGGAAAKAAPAVDADDDIDEEGAVSYAEPARSEAAEVAAAAEPSPKEPAIVKNRRVYISHGSNKKIVEQLKELLSYGDFEPVVSVEKETTARPLSEKVLGEMRSCGAGIIHVGTEQTIIDKDGNEHTLLNYNVLIEIGAAMALYGSNYILLVEEGTKLPSNAYGLYEARYKGDALDHDGTMKVLRSLKEIKS
jgi:predicted nucleotide-binding protein